MKKIPKHNTPLVVALALAVALQSMAGLALAGEADPPPHATGQLHRTFHERHPLNNLQELCKRLDIDLNSPSLARPEKVQATQEYDLAAESLLTIVPTSYNSRTPHGLLVWMGVGPASPAWAGALSQHKLILVSAVAERSSVGFVRMRLPLDCVHNMTKLYNIDPRRVCVAGFSAGAGVAVSMVCGFPDVFHGGCFFLGGRFYRARKDETGRYEPTLDRLCPQWKGPVADLGKDMRLVFVRAQGDTLYSPQEDLTQCTGLLLDGFQRAHFVTIPSGGHKPPDATWFERGIAAFESPPKALLVTSPTTAPDPQPGQAAQAQRILATAELRLEAKLPKQYDKAAQEQARSRAQSAARSYLEQVIRDYPTTPAAGKARKLLGGAGPRPGQ